MKMFKTVMKITFIPLLFVAGITMPDTDVLGPAPLYSEHALDWLLRYILFSAAWATCIATTLVICFMIRAFEHHSNGGVLPPTVNLTPRILITHGLVCPIALCILMSRLISTAAVIGALWVSTTVTIGGLGIVCASPYWVRWLHSQGLLLPSSKLTGMPELTESGFPPGMHRVTFDALKKLGLAQPEFNSLLFELSLLAKILSKSGCRHIWIVVNRAPEKVLVIEGCYQTSGCGDLRMAIAEDADFEFFPRAHGENIRTMDDRIFLYPDSTAQANMRSRPWRKFDPYALARRSAPGENVIHFLQKVNARYDDYKKVGILQVRLPEPHPLIPIVEPVPESQTISQEAQ